MSARINHLSDELTQAKPTPKLFAMRIKRGIYRVEPDGLYKRCSRCKEYWPADSEFFYTSRCDADGLNDWCKACYVENRYPNGRKNIIAKEYPDPNSFLVHQTIYQ